ncbi:MAG: DedA family protein [Deltaproteobacteria bacterium]|nr:DedA family protein [Deltaproteobacteria bacterium]
MDLHATAADALAWLKEQPPWLSAAALGAAAVLEYVVPPVPGDAVSVAGGVLVAQGIISVPVALAVTTLGSIVGSMVMYGVGIAAGRYQRVRRLLGRLFTEERVERVAVSYRRWGRLIIVANRFLPGIRTTFIVAAGLFRVPLSDVIVFGGLSALLWNSLLIGVGWLVGANLEVLERVLADYTMVVWLALGGILVAIVARLWWRRRGQRS